MVDLDAPVDLLKYKKIAFVALFLMIVYVAAGWTYLPENRGRVLLTASGIIVGSFIAYYLYFSFQSEKKFINLAPGEEIILETRGGNVYATAPKFEGGFISDGPPSRVNLFLTNRAIIAEPLDFHEFNEKGEMFVFYIPLTDILNFTHERKILSDYIRLSFVPRQTPGEQREILLFPGKESEKWIMQLRTLL